MADDEQESTTESGRDSTPLEDLANELGERRNRREDGRDDDLEEAFEAVDVGEVDSDELWKEVFDEDDPATDVGGVGGPVGDVGEAGEVPSDVGSDATDATAARAVDPENRATAAPEYTVSKREYCQRCPYFSDPPESVCTHEGTDIVEVVTVERFRVRNCPMVDRD